MKAVCAGILIWRKDDDGKVRFFVGTPGGPYWRNRECWNFPKGHVEEGEDVFDCAIREFWEETGVEMTRKKSDYVYAGQIKQRSDKVVNVYMKRWSGEKLDENCHSNMFVGEDGKEYPEIGSYAWMTYDEIKERGGVYAYYRLFEDITNMCTK